MRSTSGVRGREGRRDYLSNTLQVRKYVVVPEAQHAIAFGLEKGSSTLIGVLSRMLTTIGFHDQPALLAHEIGNEWTDRLLPPELGAIQLAVAERGPELALGIGHFAAQALGPCERLTSVAGHALTLPPLRGSFPLPRGERELRAAFLVHPARRR